MSQTPPPPADATADPLFDEAVAAHRAGRLEEAERLYLARLAQDPPSFRACLNLGVLHLGRKAFGPAEARLAAALAIEPGHLQAWDLHINAMIGGGRFAEAERVIAEGGGRGDAAVAAEVRLRQYWAAALEARKDFDGAEAQLRRMCELTPQDPEACNDLGRLLLAAGRPQDALAALDRALQLAPDHLAATTNRGSACQALGRRAEAEASYRRALALAPADLSVAFNLGALLKADGRIADAIAAYEQSIRGGGDPYENLCRIGSSHLALGHHAEALAVLDAAAALKPADHSAAYRRAFVRLMTGDFAAGWSDYEARWRDGEFLANVGGVPAEIVPRLRRHPTRDDFAGRSVLVLGEQGIGDLIMFASVLPDLSRDAAKVACICEARLGRLFANAFPDVTFSASGGVNALAGEDGVVVAIGSLPHAYRRRREDFPGTPYLRPRDEVRQRWAERLGPKPAGLRIGLSWRGGSVRTRSLDRSVSPEQLAPLLALPGCEFVSLQYGDASADLAQLNAGRSDPIRSFPASEIDDFEDLAGLVANLDLVVSVQTALVHLSGALGVECLTLIPHRPEWRYGAAGSTMPWYASVRLFRQSEGHAWPPVIARVAEVVRERLRAAV